MLTIVAISALVIAVLAYTKTETAIRAEDFITHYPQAPIFLNAFIDAQQLKTANIVGSSKTGTIFNNIVFGDEFGPKLFSDSENQLAVSTNSAVSKVLTSASPIDAAQVASGILDAERQSQELAHFQIP